MTIRAMLNIASIEESLDKAFSDSNVSVFVYFCWVYNTHHVIQLPFKFLDQMNVNLVDDLIPRPTPICACIEILIHLDGDTLIMVFIPILLLLKPCVGFSRAPSKK